MRQTSIGKRRRRVRGAREEPFSSNRRDRRRPHGRRYHPPGQDSIDKHPQASRKRGGGDLAGEDKKSPIIRRHASCRYNRVSLSSRRAPSGTLDRDLSCHAMAPQGSNRAIAAGKTEHRTSPRPNENKQTAHPIISTPSPARAPPRRCLDSIAKNLPLAACLENWPLGAPGRAEPPSSFHW